jgi:hypothetical protein
MIFAHDCARVTHICSHTQVRVVHPAVQHFVIYKIQYLSERGFNLFANIQKIKIVLYSRIERGKALKALPCSGGFKSGNGGIKLGTCRDHFCVLLAEFCITAGNRVLPCFYLIILRTDLRFQRDDLRVSSR